MITVLGTSLQLFLFCLEFVWLVLLSPGIFPDDRIPMLDHKGG